MITRHQVDRVIRLSEAGLTQDEIALQLGVRRETLWRWRDLGKEIQARLDAAAEAGEALWKQDPAAYEATEATWVAACDPDSLNARDRLYYDLVIALGGVGRIREKLAPSLLAHALVNPSFALTYLDSLDRRHAPQPSAALAVEVEVGTGPGGGATATARIGLPPEVLRELASVGVNRHRELREAQLAQLQAERAKAIT